MCALFPKQLYALQEASCIALGLMYTWVVEHLLALLVNVLKSVNALTFLFYNEIYIFSL